MKRKALSKKRLKAFYSKVIARAFTDMLQAPQLGRVNGQFTVKSYPIFATGFDTLRIGLPKYSKDYQANEAELLRLCGAIGAALHRVKWSDPSKTVKSATTGKDVIKPEITTDKAIQAHWAKTIKPKGKRKPTSMRDFFSYCNGAWLIEFEGAIHWIIDRQSGRTISFELYGLSQLDHDKGSVRFELLNRILAYYRQVSPNDLPILTSYDWHIDINRDYNWMMNRFVVPYTYLHNLTAKNGKRKIHMKYSKGLFLQSDTYKGDLTIVMYDKVNKNNLSDIDHLSRFELRVKLPTEDRKELSSYEDLTSVHWQELNYIGLIPLQERECYCNYQPWYYHHKRESIIL